MCLGVKAWHNMGYITHNIFVERKNWVQSSEENKTDSGLLRDFLFMFMGFLTPPPIVDQAPNIDS